MVHIKGKSMNDKYSLKITQNVITQHLFTWQFESGIGGQH